MIRTREHPFPLIERVDVERLPRAPSYSDERDSGRCLIALTYTGCRFKGQAIVRNCYFQNQSGEIVVENTRDLLPIRAARMRGTGVGMSRLAKAGFSVLRKPFMLVEPMHNCMAEMPVARFLELWKKHRDTTIGSAEARAFDPEQTPMLRLLKAHWRQHRVAEGWTRERVAKLCSMWGLTPFELCELIQWAPGHMDNFLKSAFPLPGPVAVWFYFLENFRFGVPVFPQMPPSRESQTDSPAFATNDAAPIAL